MRDLSQAQCLIVEPGLPAGWTWEPQLFGPDPLAFAEPLPIAPAPRPSDPSRSQIRLQRVSAGFAAVVAEFLDGRRSYNQLYAWFDPTSLALICEHQARMKGMPVRLGSVRVQVISEQSAEVCLRLTTPTRDHAAALRVSGAGQDWRVSELIIG